ncbi:hypothetical protein CASFOL_003350 [Castilleja foliolosa]|uniref:Uncharacterized protein n=1 Tax=Castilleja foliolosa TaxID=1961234 RepID=A0ABD3EHD3_9LAMI
MPLSLLLMIGQTRKGAGNKMINNVQDRIRVIILFVEIMSAAKANLGTSERVSEDLKKFVDQLNLLDHIRDCVLFHPESDFSKACKCDQCRPKIARLMQFEKDIQAKKRLLQKYNSETNDKEELCSGISDCADLTKQLFDLLQKKLEAVYEELGVPWRVDNSSSAAKLGNIDEKIRQILIERGLCGEPDEKDPNLHYPNDLDVLNKIRIG